MKLVPYANLALRINHISIYTSLSNVLEYKYGGNQLDLMKINSVLHIDNIQNKTILDLGCGSTNSHDNISSDRIYEPWFMRALHEYGVKVIGIDIAGLKDELFEGHNINLTKNNSLNIFNDNSIDVACAFSFFDSPTLNKYKYGQEVFKEIVPQLQRIVKPEGFFVFDAFCSGYKPTLYH